MITKKLLSEKILQENTAKCDLSKIANNLIYPIGDFANSIFPPLLVFVHQQTGASKSRHKSMIIN